MVASRYALPGFEVPTSNMTMPIRRYAIFLTSF
jgi:hypothetical protein